MKRNTGFLLVEHPKAASGGFTLVELLVAITIIVLLLALLAPALDRAMDQAQLAVCASNMHAIHNGVSLYALANKSIVLQCRAGWVQISIDGPGVANAEDPGHALVDWVQAMASVGLASSSKSLTSGNVQRAGVLRNEPSKAWDCPSRGFRSNWDDAAAAGTATVAGTPVNAVPGSYIIIGYQFFGGIRTWKNMEGTFPARSPVKVNKSEPGWVLAADTTMKIDNAWGGGPADRQTTCWKGMPSHKGPDGLRPAGHNQVYMDGSVGWVPFEEMYYITCWGANSPGRAGFFHQQDLGTFSPGALSKAMNYW